jgi:hypothetical protein
MSESGAPNSLQGKTDAFLREFFEKGEAMIRELIGENERLKTQLDAPLPEDVDTSDPNVIRSLVGRINALESEIEEIRRIAGAVERESGGYRERLDELESEHYDLACRHVAATQFQTSETIEEVLRATTEILLNFAGVGAFCVYLADEEKETFFPVMREGGEVAEYPEEPIADIKARVPAMEAAQSWRPGDTIHPWKAGELMAVPLFAGSRLVGVARLESFLSQKTRFTPGDHELVALISEHAGIGVENAWVRAHADDAPMARAAVEDLVRA